MPQSGFFTRTALRTVSLRFSSAGGCRFPSPMSARYLLVTCALAVRRCCYSRLMSVINLSSPTAVAGRILPANSSQTQCLQGFNPLVDRLSFEPLCGLLSSGEWNYSTLSPTCQLNVAKNSKIVNCKFNCPRQA